MIELWVLWGASIAVVALHCFQWENGLFLLSRYIHRIYCVHLSFITFLSFSIALCSALSSVTESKLNLLRITSPCNCIASHSKWYFHTVSFKGIYYHWNYLRGCLNFLGKAYWVVWLRTLSLIVRQMALFGNHNGWMDVPWRYIRLLSFVFFIYIGSVWVEKTHLLNERGSYLYGRDRHIWRCDQGARCKRLFEAQVVRASLAILH